VRFYLYTHVAHRCATGCPAFVVKTTSVPPLIHPRGQSPSLRLQGQRLQRRAVMQSREIKFWRAARVRQLVLLRCCSVLLVLPTLLAARPMNPKTPPAAARRRLGAVAMHLHLYPSPTAAADGAAAVAVVGTGSATDTYGNTWRVSSTGQAVEVSSTRDPPLQFVSLTDAAWRTVETPPSAAAFVGVMPDVSWAPPHRYLESGSTPPLFFSFSGWCSDIRTTSWNAGGWVHLARQRDPALGPLSACRWVWTRGSRRWPQRPACSQRRGSRVAPLPRRGGAPRTTAAAPWAAALVHGRSSGRARGQQHEPRAVGPDLGRAAAHPASVHGALPLPACCWLRAVTDRARSYHFAASSITPVVLRH
jgi:hypothetical protein